MNIFNFLVTKLGRRPQTVTTDQLAAVRGSVDQSEMMRKFGIVHGDLQKALAAADMINYERQSLYSMIDRSMAHPLMAATPSIFADVATTYNRVQNATVWGTAKTREYEYQLAKFLDIINIEENIYDWAFQVSAFGDLFVTIYGEPGIGIVSISDEDHPLSTSRVDYAGRLVGFYETSGGYQSSGDHKLEPPWSKVHFRLLGAKKRKPMYGGQDSNYSEFRTVSIMAPDVRRLTSKYGTSVLSDALPIYKRLRLSEDSIMMSRITRGVLRYLYKIGIDPNNTNNEAVTSLIDNYVATLKEARNFNVDLSNPSFGSKFNGMAGLEDLIIPVFGDVNQLTVQELGGAADIKWIEDVEMLTKQLATALKVPLPLLAGYASEANGGIGQNSLEKLDIRFARQARRIQRAIIVGLTRMFQIHLAYQGIDPDLDAFQIHMSETSTAEELEMQEALDKGVDVTNKVLDLLERVLKEDFNSEEALEYLNEKFLKLTDIDLDKLKLKVNKHAIVDHDDTITGDDSSIPSGLGSAVSFDTDMRGESNPFQDSIDQSEPSEETEDVDVISSDATRSTKEEEDSEEEETKPVFRERVTSSDFKSLLPLNEDKWRETWGKTTIKIEEGNFNL